MKGLLQNTHFAEVPLVCRKTCHCEPVTVVFRAANLKSGGFPRQYAHWLGMTPLFQQSIMRLCSAFGKRLGLLLQQQQIGDDGIGDQKAPGGEIIAAFIGADSQIFLYAAF